MTTAAIQTHGLTKFYGETPGIIDLDLRIEIGEVFGFIGPNGAGKSTTIRTLLNFLHPTKGSGSVLGLDIGTESLEIRRRIGYLPGDLVMYPAMTGREILAYFANLRSIDADARVDELADRFELDLDRRIKDYSTGNRQKVGLVNAFMHDPELLILDEPTSGLDPLMQQEFQALINETRDAGKTVFLSSHILPEVDRVADRVGVVRESRLIAVDTLEGFKAKSATTMTIEFAQVVDADQFERLESVRSAEHRNGGKVVHLTVTGSADAVLKAAAEHTVVSLTTDHGDLDDVFLSYYSGTQDG
jgi:ABC-2 type transport system ATP-binding protein